MYTVPETWDNLVHSPHFKDEKQTNKKDGKMKERPEVNGLVQGL